MPENFSAVYAVVFCSGVFLRSRVGATALFSTLFVTDMALNCYYQFSRGFDVFTVSGWLYLLGQYAGYAVVYGLGTRFKRGSRWLALVGGGVLSAFLFYVVTNTAAWWINPFRNPEYLKTLAGWWTALTKGTGGYPETWTFFRNTLLSGGLFSALFAGVHHLTASESPREKGEESPVPADAQPEEASVG